MSFTIRQATRQGIIPLLGLWGGTGGGKTESALRLAIGMAGKTGKVGVIDTEGRRASYYADSLPFQAIDFDAPYTPERYADALDLLEKNCDVGVIDSASHCWEGPDGVLDLHEQALDRMLKEKKDDWQERARLNWPAWREPKMRFAVLRNRILAFKKPLVICFRGKIKSRMVKDGNRNVVEKDENTTPIFDDSFIFEMHVAMEVFQKDGKGGFICFPSPYAKTSHRDIRGLLPKEFDEQLTMEHGRKLMEWCSSPGTSTPTPTTASADPKRELLIQLWQLAKPVRGEKTSDPKTQWTIFEVWAAGQEILTETEEVSTMTLERLREVITQTKEKLPKV